MNEVNKGGVGGGFAQRPLFGRSNLEPGGGERSKEGSGKHRKSGLVMQVNVNDTE